MTNRFVLAGLMLATTTCAFAQSAPPPNGDSAAPIVRARAQHGRADDRGRGGMPGGDMRGDMRGGPGARGMMLPPGTWWRDSAMAQRIGVTPEQQKRMDDIFLQSRVQLIHMHATLEEQELTLEPLMNTNPVDQGKALAQISKIADTRADLEKANAKMLLGIRAVLTAEQWTKLQTEHRGGGMHGGGRGMDGERGSGMHGRGPGGPQGMPPGV